MGGGGEERRRGYSITYICYKQVGGDGKRGKENYTKQNKMSAVCILGNHAAIQNDVPETERDLHLSLYRQQFSSNNFRDKILDAYNVGVGTHISIRYTHMT